MEVARNRGVKTQGSSLLQYLASNQQEYRIIILGSPISTFSSREIKINSPSFVGPAGSCLAGDEGSL